MAEGEGGVKENFNTFVSSVRSTLCNSVLVLVLGTSFFIWIHLHNNKLRIAASFNQLKPTQRIRTTNTEKKKKKTK